MGRTGHETGLRPAGEHGGDGRGVARDVGVPVEQVLDLSASLNPFAPDIVKITRRIAGLADLGAYPDPEPATALFARHLDVDPRRVVLTNGGSEAIALVASELGDGLVIDPEFSLYRRHLRTGEDATVGRWRSNPSSPLGAVAPDDHTAVVWDEAFWPMTMGSWTRGDETSWRVGSLTKLWACPGVRIGYVITPDAAAAGLIRDAQPRWSVNALALALVAELLPLTDLATTATRIAEHRATFASAVTARGYSVRSGIAPWLLLDDSPSLRAVLAPTGIVVRDCMSFGMPGVHRIGLPRPVDIDRVLDALDSARNT